MNVLKGQYIPIYDHHMGALWGRKHGLGLYPFDLGGL